MSDGFSLLDVSNGSSLALYWPFTGPSLVPAYLEVILRFEALSRLEMCQRRTPASRDHIIRISSIYEDCQHPEIEILRSGAAYASLCGSGMLDSTLLISWAPNPVAVRLCFGRVNPGPTGPCRVEIGAPIEAFRSLGDAVPAVAMMSYCIHK